MIELEKLLWILKEPDGRGNWDLRAFHKNLYDYNL
jgi:hypothetical protein